MASLHSKLNWFAFSPPSSSSGYRSRLCVREGKGAMCALELLLEPQWMYTSVPKPERHVVQGQLGKPQTPQNAPHSLAESCKASKDWCGIAGVCATLPTCSCDYCSLASTGTTLSQAAPQEWLLNCCSSVLPLWEWKTPSASARNPKSRYSLRQCAVGAVLPWPCRGQLLPSCGTTNICQMLRRWGVFSL